MSPLVTAVITTYNRDKEMLKRAIDSVLNQTYKNIELLVIDDNGVDSEYRPIVEDLINKHYSGNEKITLIQHENNQGVQRARNNGIQNANGEFIAYLDDDDEWLTDKIKKQVQVFREDKNKDIALVYGWYIQLFQDNKNKTKTIMNKTPEYSYNTSFVELLRINYIGSTSVPLLRKESVIEVGGFDETLPASQDYDMWLRLTKEFQIRSINEPLVRYYFHTGERISSDLTKKETATRKILNKYFYDIKKDNWAYGNRMILLGNNLLHQNRFSEGRLYLKRGIVIHSHYKYRIISIMLIIKSYWTELKKNTKKVIFFN